MSRIGKQPITIPAGVTVTVDKNMVTAQGPQGTISRRVHRDISVAIADGILTCSVTRHSKQASALWGTTRAVLNNIITGVQEGFQKKLELHGVGYRAALKGSDLEMQLGFSHPVTVPAPEGISFSVQKNIITVEGADIIRVGQVTADIRAIRPPEPYKGKGIRYVGEHVRRKVGKVAGTEKG